MGGVLPAGTGNRQSISLAKSAHVNDNDLAGV